VEQMKKTKKIKIHCECGGNHYLLVQKDEDNLYYFSTIGDCGFILGYGKQIEKLRKFLEK